MSTKKHTDGPWEMHTDAHGRGLIYAESRWLATTWRANGEGNDAPYLPSEANARLIAAAPEMLEALKISRGNVASLNAAHPAIWGEWLKVIDAAISKAEAAQ
jgi:hypothetical protein